MSSRRNAQILKAGLGAIVLVFSVSAIAFAGDTKAEVRSLYDRLGGLMPISVVVNDFIDAIVPDPFINLNPAIDEARKRVPSPYLKYQVTALVCQATGGPCQYVGRNMKDSHAHLNISEAEWDRMVVIFKEVLDQHKVPAPEQQGLMEIIDSTKSDIVAVEMSK